MATTLFEFYKAKGQTLPSVTERAPLAAQYGITDYTGTAEQNTRLLAALQGGIGVTPSGADRETPAGDLPSLPPSGPLGNLRQALRFAAEEAGKERVAGRLEQFGEAGLGRTPGTLGSIADIVRGSVQPRVEQTFSDRMKTFEDQQDFALQLTGRYPDSGILPSDSPETAARKASRAPSFLKSLKGEPTVAEKEQAEARVSEAELERKRGEGGFVDMNEYRRMKARSLLNSQEFDRRFFYFLSEGDQSRIKAESSTKDVTGDFSRADQIIQANLEIIDQVDAGGMNQFVDQIRSIIQQNAPSLTEGEINARLGSVGFRKFGSVWVYQP